MERFVDGLGENRGQYKIGGGGHRSIGGEAPILVVRGWLRFGSDKNLKGLTASSPEPNLVMWSEVTRIGQKLRT